MVDAETNVNVIDHPQLEKLDPSQLATQKICQVSCLMPDGRSLDTACIIDDFGRIIIGPALIWNYLQAVLSSEPKQ